MFSDLDRPIWGVPAIAEVVNRTPSKVYYLLERGHLPARKIGKIWCSTPRELLAAVIGRTPEAA
jgi:hypothetical protein